MSKKVIFGLLMICVVAGLVAVGTWAYFSDVEYSEDNTFAAGSLDLKVDGMDDPDVATYFSVECVKPGDMGSATITLTNEGCCVPALADIHIMNLVDEENGLKEPEVVLGDTEPVGELSQYMWITMTAYDAGGAVQWYQEGWLDVLNCQNFIMGPLDPDTAITVVITWEIPEGTGNIIMTDTVNFDIEFSLDQAVGEPADMSLTDIVQPSTAIVCDMTTVSVDVYNDGDVTGSATVTLDIGQWSQSKTVTVTGGATVTVDFEWHADAPGPNAVMASIPDDGGVGPHELECPDGITVFTPPSFEGEWEEPLPLEVYVCDTLVVGAILHNIGDVPATVDVTLTIEVDGVEKHSETVPGVTLDPCVPVVVVFAPWHVIDPVSMTGNLVVDIDGIPVLTGSITIIDLEPVVSEISPATCTSLEPPGSVTIQARVTDDGGVLGAGYTIDDPMGAPVPMVLTSGDPLDGHYESVVDWDYSAAALGDHTIYVGGMDGAGNMGGNAAVVHVEKAVWDISAISVSPNPAVECDTVTISIDVHNSGNVSGSVTIIVQIDGVTVINETVTVDPCQTVTLTYTFHPDVGSYTVAGMGQASVTLVVNPAQVQPSTLTVYDANYNSGTYTNQCELSLHLVALGVNPIPDLVPLCIQVPIPPGPAAQGDLSFNPNVERTTAGTTILAMGGTTYSSMANGLSLYVYVLSMMGVNTAEVEMSMDGYTLLTGSHMGQPYEVGCSWSYTTYTDIALGGFMCLGMTPTPGNVVTVVSDGETDPSGNYTDCIKIETDNPNPGIKTDWYSVGTGCIVYTIDDQSYDGVETWELISYTPVY